MAYGYGSGYGQNDERVSDVLSQETIRSAIDNAARNSAGSRQQQSSSAQYGHSSYEPDRPGLARRDTATRRDPLTGDLVEEYNGADPSGLGVRAHYNWDEPGKAPSNFQPQSSRPGGSSQDPRPSGPPRTNTNVSYDSSGNRIEEHDGQGSLPVRALYNEDGVNTNIYRPDAPPRHQSEGGSGYRP